MKKKIFFSFLEIDQKAENIKKESVDIVNQIDRPDLPVDWKPQDKCYFCVDGKLLKVNEAGELVAEAGPVQSEAELTNRVSSFSTLKKFFESKMAIFSKWWIRGHS